MKKEHIHISRQEEIVAHMKGKGKSLIEAGFYHGEMPKGHEVNNMFIRLRSFDGLETGFDMTVDEAATIIQFLAVCIEAKTLPLRNQLAPKKEKKSKK